ncbi:hypothetical protein JDV09_21365, partial [Mycobacterium sp. Y57]|nr:hypothetical protein [Mycolicibacterium xanthum]
CKCRLHHLMKTFWQGWKEVQLPDGTLQVTTPTGHTYTTKPFSALLFPSWNTTTADPPPAPAPNPPPRTPGRELMMPTRRRTRAQNHAAYITRERHLNALQRELDRAAAQKAAEERRAKRAALLATPGGAQWAARLERIDHLLQPLSHPPEQPDYGNDPPPF